MRMFGLNQQEFDEADIEELLAMARLEGIAAEERQKRRELGLD